MKYIQPKVYSNSFTCPHCGVLSKQRWNWATWKLETGYDIKYAENKLRVGYCDHCGERTLWIEEKMLFPENGQAPFPNPEMPESVRKLYLEAASISNKSPKGAAALLRLSIQLLCKELGEKGENINNDI